MPGDPRACRENARRCAELAALAATPEEREHLLSLEQALSRYAAELESAEAFFKTMQEIVLKQPHPPEAAA
jgi:CHASE3 domain sensor protein